MFFSIHLSSGLVALGCWRKVRVGEKTDGVCVLLHPPTSTSCSAWGATNPENIFPLLYLVFTSFFAFSGADLERFSWDFPRIAYCIILQFTNSLAMSKIFGQFSNSTKNQAVVTFSFLWIPSKIYNSICTTPVPLTWPPSPQMGARLQVLLNQLILTNWEDLCIMCKMYVFGG